MSTMDKTFLKYMSDAGYQQHKQPPKSVGIEVELESSHSHVCDEAMGWACSSVGWAYHGEDSLRHGFEFVFHKPKVVGSPDYNHAISSLNGFLTEHKDYLVISPRTSTHVHVNIQHYTIRQLYNIISNVYLFENVISNRCTANRKGNLFCVRGCDAEAVLFMFTNIIKNSPKPPFVSMGQDQFKYGALNLAAIAGKGTVEFRFMDASTDSAEIDMWARALEHFVSKAANSPIQPKIDKIRNNTFNFKAECKSITGEYFDFFTEGMSFSQSSFKTMVMDNVLGVIELENAIKKKKSLKAFNHTIDLDEFTAAVPTFDSEDTYYDDIYDNE